MKKKLAFVLAVLASAAGAFQMGYLRMSGGIACTILCAGGEVIVDSGPLTSGDYALGVWLNTNATNTNVQIQHRNAANDQNVRTINVFIPANGSVSLPVALWAIPERNQRVRVVLVGPLTDGTRVSGVMTW